MSNINSLCVGIEQNGNLIAHSIADDNYCSGSYILVSGNDYAQLMQYTRINAADATQAFAFGFFAVLLTSWGLTYSIRVAQKLIKLL